MRYLLKEPATAIINLKRLSLVVRACLAAVAASLPLLVAATGTEPGLAIAFEQAWRLNPRAAELDFREAEARAARDVAAGITPEPGTISISRRSDRLGPRAGRQEYEVEVAAPLWLPGQKTAREVEADDRVAEVTAARNALRLELAGVLREAWWTLAAASHAKTLAAQRLDTARALDTNVQRRYAVGDLSRIDANLARGEVHVAESELLEVETAYSLARQGLQALTGTVPPANVDAALPVVQGRFVPPEMAPESHPLIVAAEAAARSSRSRSDVVRHSRRAAPELALRVVNERGSLGEPAANSVGLVIKIPFSSAARTDRDFASAQAEVNRAAAEFALTRIRVHLDVERAQRGLRTAQLQFAAAARRRDLAVENLQLAERAFSLGETDLVALLRVRATNYDAVADHHRQEVAVAAAQSRVLQSLGVLP